MNVCTIAIIFACLYSCEGEKKTLDSYDDYYKKKIADAKIIVDSVTSIMDSAEALQKKNPKKAIIGQFKKFVESVDKVVGQELGRGTEPARLGVIFGTLKTAHQSLQKAVANDAEEEKWIATIKSLEGHPKLYFTLMDGVHKCRKLKGKKPIVVHPKPILALYEEAVTLRTELLNSFGKKDLATDQFKTRVETFVSNVNKAIKGKGKARKGPGEDDYEDMI